MAGLLRSRRGKDLAAFLVIPIFALYEAFAQVVPRLAAEGKITAATFARIDRWLRWLPPGLAAHAIQDASTGHAGAALLRLGLLAAVITVLGGLWIRSLGRALVTVDTSTQSSAVSGAPLPFARFGIRGTVAGRYLIYQRREPGSIIRWCIIAIVMAAASVSTIRTPSYHVALILSAVLGAGMLSIFNSNSIGITGPGTASRWPGPARVLPPARPIRGCRSSARSPSAASCSRIRAQHPTCWQSELQPLSLPSPARRAQPGQAVLCTRRLCTVAGLPDRQLLTWRRAGRGWWGGYGAVPCRGGRAARGALDR
jgi:hypothetical protein